MVKVNRSFDPGNNPAYTDPARNPNQDPDWEDYRYGQRMKGGESTAGQWASSHNLHDLLQRIQGVNSAAGITKDGLGRSVIAVSQWMNNEEKVSHVHLDSQTGGITVNNPNNPGGGFFVTPSITDMKPLAGAQYGSKQEFLGAAQKAGVFKTAEDMLLGALGSGRDVVETARKQLTATMQTDEGSPYVNYSELSPQSRTRWANSIALPGYQQDDKGVKQKLYANDYANFLESTGTSSIFGVKSGSSRLLDLQSYEAANYPQNERGEFYANKVKRDTQQGSRDSLAYYQSPSPAGAVPAMTSPIRYDGQVEANSGYKQKYLYTMHNAITPEGQGWAREDAGLLRRDFTRIVKTPEAGLDSLGIASNRLYGNGLNPAEGQDRGDLGQLEKVLGKRFGSYQGVSVDSITQNDDGTSTISGGAYIPMSGTSRKFKQKGIVGITPDSSGIIPQGYDVVMGAPGGADIAGLGERALSARYDSTASFKKAFTAYATGYDNLSDDSKSWVDDNASWVKNAPGAGGFSEEQAGKLFRGGRIGGKNAEAFNNMSRDFAMSNMRVQEWQDQTVDAGTYELHKDTMIGDKPMFEGVTRVSGEGDSAMYRVNTLRDHVIDAEVYDKMQPEFARGSATLPAESLNNMARYNPGMYNYLKEAEGRGAFQNPAMDIVTATRANYGGEEGERARAALNSEPKRAIYNLDDAKLTGRSGLNLSQMYNEARTEGEGLSESEIDQSYLRKIADVTGNHALQVGDMVLPSAKAALNMFTMNEDGEAISNAGSAIAKALVAQGNVQEAATVGGGAEYTRQRDELAYNALSETAQMMEDDPSGNFAKRATGMTMDVLDGPAIASKALAPGSIAASESDIFRLTNARSDEERQQVRAMLGKGQLTAMTQMFPEANTAHSSIQNTVMSNEMVNAAAGKQILSGENRMHMAEATAFALGKDFDGDTQRTIMGGMFSGEGPDRKWIQANVAAQSSSDVMGIARRSVAGEIEKQQETAARTPESMAAEIAKTKPKSLRDTVDENGETVKGLGSGYLDTLRAKSNMGPMYNVGIRGFSRFSDLLQSRAGFNSPKTQEASSGFSQYPYQAAIDLEVDNDPNLKKMVEMTKTLNFESSKSGNQSSSFYASGGNGVEVEGGKFKNTLAADVMSTFAGVGLSGEDPAAAAEKYKSKLAPHLAGMMLPINATDEQREAATGMLNDYADEYAKTGELGKFDTRKFTGIAGKKSELHWFVGGEGEDLASQVPAAAYIAGKSAERLDLKNPGKASAKMGLQSTFQEMTEQVGAFYEGKNAESVEGHLNALNKQAPELNPQSLDAARRMGGTGSGKSARGAIQHLSPANRAAASLEETGVASEDFHYDETTGKPVAGPTPGAGTPRSGNFTAPDAPDGISDAAYSAGSSGGGSSGGGGGSVGSLPFDAPEPQSSGSGSSGQGSAVPMAEAAPAAAPAKPGQMQFPIGNLNRTRANAAITSLQYLRGNQGRIEEIADAVRGGADVQPYSNEIKAALKAYGTAEGTYSLAKQRKTAGIAFGGGDKIAAQMFDPGSDNAADPVLGAMSSDFETLTDKYTKHQLATTAAKEPTGPKRPDALGQDEIGEAVGMLGKFNEQMKEMGTVLAGVTKGQHEHIEQSKVLSKTYDDLSKKAKTISDRGDIATPQEKDLLEKLGQAGIGPGEVGSDSIGPKMNELKYETGKMIGSGSYGGPTLGDEEQQMKMMDALMSGGRSGQKKRMKLTDDDYERGIEGPLGTQITGEGKLNAIGGIMRGTAKLQNAMWAATHVAGNILEPMTQAADFYTNRQGARDMNLLQSGSISFNDMMGGVGGEVRRRDIRGANFQEEFGRQIYNSYGGLMNAGGGDAAGRTAGAAASIAGPAIGAAIMMNQLAGPVGGAIAGAGVAALATGNYFVQSTQDVKGLSSTQGINNAQLANQPDNIFGKLAAGAGTFLSDPVGAMSLAGSRVFNPEVAQEAANQSYANETADEYFAGGGGWASSFSPSDLAKYNESTFGMSRGAAAATSQEAYLRSAGKRGVSEEEALGIYSFSQMYGRDRNMSDPVFKGIEELSISGVMDLPGTVTSLASQRGIAPNDRAGIFGVAEGLTTNLMGRPEAERGITAQTLLQGSSRFSSANAARRIAGMGNMTDDQMIAAESRGDAYATVTEGIESTRANRAIMSPMSMASNNLAQAAMTAQGRGDLAGAMRVNSSLDTTQQAASAAFRLQGGDPMAATVGNLQSLSAQIALNPVTASLGPGFQQSTTNFMSYANTGSQLNALGLTSNYTNAAAGLSARGIDPMSLAAARLGRTGQAGTAAQMEGFVSPLLDQMSDAGFDVEGAEAEYLTAGAENSVSQGRRLSGRGTRRSLSRGERNSMLANDAVGAAFGMVNAAADSAASSQNGFYAANESKFNRLDTLAFNRPADAVLGANQMSQAAGAYAQNLGTYTNSAATAQSFGNLTSLPPQQFAQAMSAAQGNQVALGQMAAGGNQAAAQYSTMNMQTGLQNSQYGMAGGASAGTMFMSNARAVSFAGQMGLNSPSSYAQSVYMKGGTAGLQTEMANVGFNAQMAQAGLQMQGIALSRAMTTGGASGVDSQGFAVGGDGMKGAQGAFKKYGGLNAGNGMGFWQIEDAMTGISREKQTFQLEQSGQGLGIAQGQFDLAGKQFYEKWNLNKEQFDYNTGYQRQEMQIGRGIQLQQRGWQAEDMSFQRDKSELNFGWQMEDADRSLKYSRGRERLDIQRNKSRAVISHSMEVGQMDKQEDRFATTNKQADEAFERQKKHFEQGVKFQEREMEMQKKHFEEGRKFDQQRLDMQKSAHEKEAGWLKETFKLEDQKRLLERQYWLVQNDMSMQGAAISAGAAAKSKELNDQLTAVTASEQALAAEMALKVETGALVIELEMGINKQRERMVEMGPAVAAGVDKILGMMAAIQGWKPPEAPASGGATATAEVAPEALGGEMYGGHVGDASAAAFKGMKFNPRGFASGGYTGDGMKHEVAGVVHKGEYVIPQNGALVKGGSSKEELAVLQSIDRELKAIRAMGPGRVQATIHTTEKSVDTSTLTAKDKAYSRVKQ